jgi:hypothetical protein
VNEFSMEDLTSFLALLAGLSMAAERLVEILKTFVFTNLSTVKTDLIEESRRQVKIQIISLVAAILTALLLLPLGIVEDWWIALALGFLASGGSSLWNSVLGWANGLKDLRQTDGKQARLAEQAVGMKKAA